MLDKFLLTLIKYSLIIDKMIKIKLLKNETNTTTVVHPGTWDSYNRDLKIKKKPNIKEITATIRPKIVNILIGYVE